MMILLGFHWNAHPHFGTFNCVLVTVNIQNCIIYYYYYIQTNPFFFLEWCLCHAAQHFFHMRTCSQSIDTKGKTIELGEKRLLRYVLQSINLLLIPIPRIMRGKNVLDAQFEHTDKYENSGNKPTFNHSSTVSLSCNKETLEKHKEGNFSPNCNFGRYPLDLAN